MTLQKFFTSLLLSKKTFEPSTSIGTQTNLRTAAMRLAQAERPPLRVVLGQDALDLQKKRIDQLLQERESWYQLSSQTAFPNGADASQYIKS